jgi:hypothetical protein
MRTLRRYVFLLLVSSVPAISRAQAVDPQADYERAVKVYIEAATEQLQAIRGQIDVRAASISTDEEKKAFEAVYQQVDACDQLLVELKKSGPKSFDTVKSRLEQKRAEMIKFADALRKSS